MAQAPGEPTPGGGWVGRHPRTSLAAAVALGLVLTVALRAGPPPAQRLALTPVVLAVLNDLGSPALGNASADVTIVVFTDYQCPICRRTDGAIEAARRADPNVRVVYKDLSIFGEDSRNAARVALAAQLQGRYGAAHSALMTTRRHLDVAAVRQVVAAAGVDLKELDTDLTAYGAVIDAQLKRHAFEAWSLGIEGTPAYLIGPRLYRGGMGGAALRAAISTARRSPWLRGQALRPEAALIPASVRPETPARSSRAPNASSIERG
jgi:protein-disulfide isomerase